MTREKQLLVIGSAVADVIITLDHLPRRSEDVHVITQEMRLGGCAYNTYDIVRHFAVPSIPFFPVGTGAYGDFVRKALSKRGIASPIPTPDAPNGCCYCFIEKDGERTFLSYHGAEYRFEKEWFSLLDLSRIDSVYICGLEIEEPTGIHIVSFLEDFKKRQPELSLFFAPGPRLKRIRPELMRRIFALHPILHLNEEEARSYVSRQEPDAPTDPRPDLPLAAAALYGMTKAPVLITLGAAGCAFFDGERFETIPGVPARQVDTIGAGDSHIGAVMSCLKLGMSLSDSIRIANRVSAKVVSVHGALLSQEEFDVSIRGLIDRER